MRERRVAVALASMVALSVVLMLILPGCCGSALYRARCCKETPTPVTPTPVTSLVIDKVVMNSTPQSGTWLMCFMANAGSVSNTFNVPDRTYQGDGIEIYMNLKLTPVSAGTTVNFRMHLDDDQADVCAGSAEDQTSGSFPAGTGSRSFTDHDFKYVVHYHIS